jgi:hypothetical protein
MSQSEDRIYLAAPRPEVAGDQKVTEPNSSREIVIFALRLLTVIAGLFAGALTFAGIVFVILGSTGEVEINLFGSTMKSQNIGIICIFFGAVVFTLIVRRVIGALEKLNS